MANSVEAKIHFHINEGCDRHSFERSWLKPPILNRSHRFIVQSETKWFYDLNVLRDAMFIHN